MMIIIRNNIVPRPGFKAMNLFGILFVRKAAVLTLCTFNHEHIHTRQIYEMMAVGVVFGLIYALSFGWSWWLLAVCLPLFYWWYLAEFFIRVFINPGQAYENISFEREAYKNDTNNWYLTTRKPFSWISYLKI